MLKQPRFHPFSVEEEILSFMILESGILDGLDIGQVENVSMEILDKLKQTFSALIDLIKVEGRIGEKDRGIVIEFIKKAGEQG